MEFMNFSHSHSDMMPRARQVGLRLAAHGLKFFYMRLGGHDSGGHVLTLDCCHRVPNIWWLLLEIVQLVSFQLDRGLQLDHPLALFQS